MFAIVSAIFFFLAAFNVHAGTINLSLLGWAFLALHFAWTIAIPWPTYRRP